MSWTRNEVELTVSSYLAMLALEQAGRPYSKTEFREQLLAQMPSRSAAAIEFKHGNISAVMQALGLPSILGYRPRANYQQLLFDVVSERVTQSPTLSVAMTASLKAPIVAPVEVDFATLLQRAPRRRTESAPVQGSTAQRAIKRDYLEQEMRNRALGLAGEQFVMAYEQWRLNSLGRGDLARRVMHVAQSEGDGLGYDVLSFGADGGERFIEVKTTAFGPGTPFFVSARELTKSQEAQSAYRLYRLYDFRRSPRLFELIGDLSDHCELDAVSYRASFG